MLKIWRCKAFPSGIPNELMFSKKMHNKPYLDDHGVIFKQNPDEDEFDIEEAAREINYE